MRISVSLTLLYFWSTQDFASEAKTLPLIDILTVEPGENLNLNCTYNCSTGFVFANWNAESTNSGCPKLLQIGDLCTIYLCLSNVSAEETEKNYTCNTEVRDHPELPKREEKKIILKVQRKTSSLTVTPKTVTLKSENKNVSFSDEPKDSSKEEFNGIKILATVTVTVALVLAALAVYLCVNRNRHNWNGKGESDELRSCSTQQQNEALLPVKGPSTTQCERVTLRIPPPDNESETEVPYADIMITVRGVSTPELTQVGSFTGERWGDESRSHLQSSRSADRLHVPHPKEVSRKMSTNSEYAVITYA